jgi:hypothetical protein
VLIYHHGGEGVEVGGNAMKTKVGDTVRSILNGAEYKVKKIVESRAVLESQDGKNQILTELENLTLFYKKKKGKVV